MTAKVAENRSIEHRSRNRGTVVTWSPMSQLPPEVPNHAGIPNFNVQINEDGGMNYMLKHGFPKGIANTIVKEAERCPMRFFILDDSGSMASSDGSRVIQSGSRYVTVNCSRWEEMVDTVQFHEGLSKAMNAPCEFRFLNNLAPKRTGVAEIDPDDVNGRAVRKALDGSPSGMTPLCFHVTEVAREIQAQAQRLKENGQHAAVVIMCDGGASDGNVAQAMKPLAHLPCNVVVRLCTDQDDVVDYWNGVDRQLEINLDILDDPIGEASEIEAVNHWLNYGLPLHRMREWGVHIRELDMMDEQLLSSNQMITLLAILLDCDKKEIPQIAVDWGEFSAFVKPRLAQAGDAFNPVTRRSEPWVNLSQLRGKYSPNSGCCSVV